MKELIIHWLKSGDEHLILLEDQDEIVFRLQGNKVLMCATLTSTSPSNTELQSWVRLGAASLTHFQGALARAPSSGALWIIQRPQDATEAPRVLGSIESLLHQRDTWRAVYARLKKPVRQLQPTLLRSLRP
ncbi:type III secretion protein [Pseudomonas sp. W4I3]|uniref:type III secretion protein n=1 Tax=Pseudomonas sp. W4I3 TaxID=3042294 RepID=UPI0027879174|nr:type III secretion protein [Pseudomonas sp. W4I3]MDQ0738436.1 hypothetical protein [Pseudomonas sp. W4I3]